jgi:hypothetical protein
MIIILFHTTNLKSLCNYYLFNFQKVYTRLQSLLIVLLGKQQNLSFFNNLIKLNVIFFVVCTLLQTINVMALFPILKNHYINNVIKSTTVR